MQKLGFRSSTYLVPIPDMYAAEPNAEDLLGRLESALGKRRGVRTQRENLAVRFRLSVWRIWGVSYPVWSSEGVLSVVVPNGQPLVEIRLSFLRYNIHYTAVMALLFSLTPLRSVFMSGYIGSLFGLVAIVALGLYSRWVVGTLEANYFKCLVLGMVRQS